VSRELTAEYGRGFSYAELARMVQFVQLFPEESIVVTLSQQLSCLSHHKAYEANQTDLWLQDWSMAMYY